MVATLSYLLLALGLALPATGGEASLRPLELGRDRGAAIALFQARTSPTFIRASAAAPILGGEIAAEPEAAPRPATVPDGAGGFYAAWWDYRAPFAYGLAVSTIYLQRYQADGSVVPGWPLPGRRVSAGPPDQTWPLLISDGAGGVIVAWQDYGSGQVAIRAQRVDASGTWLWGASGVALSQPSRMGFLRAIAPDGAGGAYVGIDTGSATSGGSIMVQRITSNGSIASGWPAAGVEVIQSSNWVTLEHLLPGSGGDIVAVWLEDFVGAGEIRAQRISAAGALQWNGNGMLWGDRPFDTAVAEDGAGGAIVVWSDYVGTYHVYAQRFGTDGNSMWAVGGVEVCTAPEGQYGVAIAADGGGGAFVSWLDDRSGGLLYAQHLTGTGGVTLGWPANGAPISDERPQWSLSTIHPDGAGGAYLSWIPVITGNQPSNRLKVRRVNGDGTWPEGWRFGGVEITSWLAPAWGRPVEWTPDGAGGLFIRWRDSRSGALGGDWFGQRLSPDATLEWTPGGRRMVTDLHSQQAPQLTPDGAGGARIWWQQRRDVNWDLFARRMDGAGMPVGLIQPISTAPNDQVGPLATTVAGATGGVAWIDQRFGRDDLFVQRISDLQVPLWTPDGLHLSSAGEAVTSYAVADAGPTGVFAVWTSLRSLRVQRVTGLATQEWGAGGLEVDAHQFIGSGRKFIVPDGGGGAIVTWTRYTLDSTFLFVNAEIRAQRIEASGSPMWGPGGIAVAAHQGDPGFVPLPLVCTDGSAGLFVALTRWDPTGVQDTIRLLRIASDGTTAPGWPANGIVVIDSPGRRGSITIVPDGSGGAFLGWNEYHGVQWKSYAQRVTSLGTLAWNAAGVELSNASGHQYLAGLVADAFGGFFGLWVDGRSDSWDLYAQRLNAAGVRTWGGGGLPVCTAPGNQEMPVMVSDGEGGVVVAWQDARDPTRDLVYLARLNTGGTPLWSLDGVTSTTASLESAGIVDGVARIVWHVAAGQRCIVERRESGGGWKKRVTIAADGDGRLGFEDRDIEPGTRMGWRIRDGDGPGAQIGPEVWLDVPRRASFALHGPRPNPVIGDLLVSFSLASQEPAQIEVLDVSGRRLWVREVASLGAGVHVLKLEIGSSLRPGLYFVRLVQDRRQAIMKFARVE